MSTYKGLHPIREKNGQRSRRVGRPDLNLGVMPAKKRRHGLIAHTCAIYVIEAPTLSAVKIGTARNVAARLEGLQVGQVEDLLVFGAYRAEEPLVRKLEMTIHKRLCGSREHIKGEWYRFTVAHAHQMILKIAGELKILLSDDHQYPFGDLTDRLSENRMVTDPEFRAAPKIQRIRDGDWVAGLV